MSDLLSWLRATIEGDKAEAAVLPHGPWIVSVGVRRYPQRITNAAALLLAETYDGPQAPPDVANYIAKHDPQDTIARCDAELALLDEHPPASGTYLPDWAGRCQGCGESMPCTTVKLLAKGRRHRPGFNPGWVAAARPDSP